MKRYKVKFIEEYEVYAPDEDTAIDIANSGGGVFVDADEVVIVVEE